MKLAESTQLFWSIATRSEDGHDPAETFVGTPALDAASRMDIYANMFVWRQIDALREDFPKLVGLMGDEAFYALGEAYLRAHPSVHPSLSKLVHHLAAFLEQHPGSRADPRALAGPKWTRP